MLPKDEYVAVFEEVHGTILALGMIGIVLCALLFYLGYVDPVLRTHPGTIIFWAAGTDVVYSMKSTVGAVAWRYMDPNTAYGRSFNFINDNCWSAGLFGNYFGNASMLWHGIWCVNFYLELKDPLRSTSHLMGYYHGAAWLIPVVTTTVMIIRGDAALSGDLTCWTGPGSTTAWLVTGLVSLCGVLALVTLAFAFVRLMLQRGFLNTSRVRRRLMFHHAMYVVVFVAAWAYAFVVLQGIVTGNVYVRYVGSSSPVTVILVALVRLLEPDAVKVIKTVFRRGKDEERNPLLELEAATPGRGGWGLGGDIVRDFGEKTIYGIREFFMGETKLGGNQRNLSRSGEDDEPIEFEFRIRPKGAAAERSSLLVVAPGTLKRVRSICGIGPPTIARSLQEPPVFISNDRHDFVCQTSDGKFRIRAASKAEVDNLLSVGMEYAEMFQRRSLLERICGCFALQEFGSTSFLFVVASVSSIPNKGLILRDSTTWSQWLDDYTRKLYTQSPPPTRFPWRLPDRVLNDLMVVLERDLALLQRIGVSQYSLVFTVPVEFEISCPMQAESLEFTSFDANRFLHNFTIVNVFDAGRLMPAAFSYGTDFKMRVKDFFHHKDSFRSSDWSWVDNSNCSEPSDLL